jgi:arylsulfatase A-like enzyme
MKHSTFFFLLAMSAIFCQCQTGKSETVEKKPLNVLFIAVDDLRPELNTYGASHIQSPNIDRLAAGGLQFNRAYCNVPVCGASRASLMTGIYPTHTRFVGYSTKIDEDAPAALTLHQHFKNNGYHTISNGKVLHHQNDAAEGWNENWRPAALNITDWRDYQSQHNITQEQVSGKQGYPYEVADVHDTAYFDGRIAQKSIDDLKKLKDKNEPFFLAVGFLKPHLPFNAPKKYWDMYPAENIALPDDYYWPENAPDAASHNFGELRAYSGIPKKGAVSDSMALAMIRGYYACVSYTDAQIGKLLQSLNDLGMADNTIVILWGDHGWSLGNHTLWCKHSNFHVAMHTPMIVTAPGYEADLETNALVEYVDIYPSLCELTGLPVPDHLQGRSFVPLMRDPAQPWKEAVFVRYQPGNSVVTDQYAYTEYINKDGQYAEMLYDLTSDPAETNNLAGQPAKQETQEKLSKMLHEKIAKAHEADDMVNKDMEQGQ